MEGGWEVCHSGHFGSRSEVDVHRLCDGDCSSFRAAADRNGGQSIGAGVPGREEMGLCGKRGHLGGLERSESLGRDNLRGGDEGKCSNSVDRKEAQVWALPGPAGRGRVHMPWRRHAVPLVQSLCGQNGGVTCRSGKPHVGTDVGVVEEGEDSSSTSFYGLRDLDAFLSEGVEIDKTFVMQEDGSFVAKMVAGPASYQQWLASFRVMRTAFIMLDLLPLNLLLQWENHMERLVSRYPNCWHLIVEAENKSRAEHLGRTPGFGEALHRSWRTSSFWMEGVRTLASRVEESAGGCGVLAGTSSCTSIGMVSSRGPGSAADAGRGSGEGRIAGWLPSFACRESQGGQWGRRRSPEDVCKQVEKRSKEEKVEGREGGVGEPKKSNSERVKRWRRRKRRWQTIRLHGGGVLCMEQWEWRVWRTSSRGGMQRPKETASSMHHMQESWSPFKGLPVEEVKAVLFLIYTKVAGNGGKSSSSTRGGRGGEGPKEPQEKKSRLGQELDEEDELIEGDRVEIGGELKSEQEYVSNRIFKFIHHFSGKTDFLSMAILEEASERKMKVVCISLDKENAGDLSSTFPYRDHVASIRKADVDGYHSGFPSREAWEKFVRLHSRVLETAETYGTKEVKVHEDLVTKWREELRRLWGTKPAPSVRLKEQGTYQTQVDFRLLRSWQERSGDPECEVPDWLEFGCPLGIEREIKTCNIFPPMAEEDVKTGGEADMAAELERKGFKNYASVEDNKADAEIEIQRYEKEGYVRRIEKEKGLKLYPGGTISRLGLVLKMKESGEKKRRGEL